VRLKLYMYLLPVAQREKSAVKYIVRKFRARLLWTWLAKAFVLLTLPFTDLGFDEHKKKKELSGVSVESRLHIAAPRAHASSGLPIVFIHQSWNDYLQYSLAQARVSNPKSPIYLLGDRANDRFDFIEHHLFRDYFTAAAAFAGVYHHHNTNPFGFELFNFQRWFVLQEFLAAHGIQQCLYLDSDTMLYADVTKEREKFATSDFTLSWGMSGNTFFLNRLKALQDFCQFVGDMYSGKDCYHWARMMGVFSARRYARLPGGICDMTAFQFYGELHFGEIGEVAQVIDGTVFEPAIASPNPGFEMENGFKKIIWNGKLPYGKHVKTGSEVRFNSLHCQGRQAKQLMKQFYTGASASETRI